MLFTQGVHNIPQTGKKSWHGANQKAWLHRNPLFCYCLKDYYLHRILWGAVQTGTERVQTGTNRVKVKDAWDEKVATGQVCTGCGKHSN